MYGNPWHSIPHHADHTIPPPKTTKKKENSKKINFTPALPDLGNLLGLNELCPFVPSGYSILYDKDGPLIRRCKVHGWAQGGIIYFSFLFSIFFFPLD